MSRSTVTDMDSERNNFLEGFLSFGEGYMEFGHRPIFLNVKLFVTVVPLFHGGFQHVGLNSLNTPHECSMILPHNNGCL